MEHISEFQMAKFQLKDANVTKLSQEDAIMTDCVYSFGKMKQMLFILYYKIKNIFLVILSLDIFSSTCFFR
jgi:hypothetical protein